MDRVRELSSFFDDRYLGNYTTDKVSPFPTLKELPTIEGIVEIPEEYENIIMKNQLSIEDIKI